MKYKPAFLIVLGCLTLTAAGQTTQVFRFGGSAYLGVQLRDIVATDVADLGLARETGVYIEEVVPDSPAQRAGLEAGDVITSFSGVPVLSVRQFQRLVSDSPEGRNVDLEVHRSGGTVKLSAELEKSGFGRGASVLPYFSPRGRAEVAPEIRMLPDRGDYRFFSTQGRPRLGIAGEPITEQLANHLEVPGKDGILVMEVVEDSAAEKAGIQAGDVILSVDGESVSTISDLSRALKGGSQQIELVRDARVVTVEVVIEEPEQPKGRRTKL